MTDPTQDPSKDDASSDDIDWAAAMAEQAAGTHQSNQAEGLAEAADDWAAALAEQTAAENAQKTAAALAENTAAADAAAADAAAAQHAAAQPAAATRAATAATAAPATPATDLFQPLVDTSGAVQSDIDMIMDIPVQLTVELGRTRLTIRNILQLGQGSVVELDGLAGEPMDIFVNGYLIAQGEVVVVDDRYGIRVTDIITPADRINRLRSRR
ncbi:flagellar motor switch protein FliN [Alcaligenaceae bacterium]|nr:flagellar motor switch protein FliN [Alcaligenaceae bacterium]